ncbi:MAG: ABC transporter permease [Phycisphaerae bacterium]
MTDLTLSPMDQPALSAPRPYWGWVAARLFRPLLVRLCAAYLAVLVLIALLVPLIANGQPYTCVVPATAGHAAMREYPLFRDLSSVDWILLVVAAALGAQGVVISLSHRFPKVQRMMRRRVGAVVITGITIIAGSLIAALHHNRLDAVNYRSLARHGIITHAVFPPVPWGYAEMEPLSKGLINQYPSHRHWLGTDGDGRDELSRLLWGARIAMGVGFVSQIIALAMGIVVGALTGYFGGIFDIILMRLVEMVESIPTFFLILTFVAVYGRHILDIMVIIGVTGWTGYARLLRAEFFRIRNLDYVLAAQGAGMPLWRVLFKHMLPNGVTPVLVSAGFGLAGAVTIEASLSYLGVGVQPPTASWGSMLNSAGNPATVFRWWQALGPGMLIFITVLAFNLFAESLRDAIDPTTMGRR